MGQKIIPAHLPSPACLGEGGWVGQKKNVPIFSRSPGFLVRWVGGLNHLISPSLESSCASLSMNAQTLKVMSASIAAFVARHFFSDFAYAGTYFFDKKGFHENTSNQNISS